MTVSAAIKGAHCTADLFAVPPVPTGGQRVPGAPVVSKQGRTSLSAWDLHVVVPYYNPFQWASRLRLHNEFMAWISGSGCQVHVVELTLGAHDHQVTQAGNPRHLQLRFDRAMPWVKENLINIGLRRLVAIAAVTTALGSIPLWSILDPSVLPYLALIWGIGNLSMLKSLLSFATTMVRVPDARLVSGLLLGATLGTAISPAVSSLIVEWGPVRVVLICSTACHVGMLLLVLLARRLQRTTAVPTAEGDVLVT